MAEAFLDDGFDVKEYWELAKANLESGKIRMRFVADSIPLELRRIIEFLNTQMRPAEVLAVESPQYMGAGLKILSPRVYGQTEKTRQNKNWRKGTQWYATSFEELISSRRGNVETQVAMGILDWLGLRENENKIRVLWGTGTPEGSYSAVGGQTGKTGSFMTVRTTGQVLVWLRSTFQRPSFDGPDSRNEMIGRLEDIANCVIKGAIEDPTHAVIPISALVDDEVSELFLSTVDLIIQQFIDAGVHSA